MTLFGRLGQLVLAAFAFCSALLLILLGLAGLLQLRFTLTAIAWPFAFFLLGASLLIGREAVRSKDTPPESTQRPSGLRSVSHQPGNSPGTDDTGLPRNSDRGHIVVTRKTHWMNKLEYLDIYLDGLRATSARDGEVVRLEVDAGHHEVQIRLRMERSEPKSVHLRAGEAARFECGSRIQGWRFLVAPYMVVWGRSLYLEPIPASPTASAG